MLAASFVGFIVASLWSPAGFIGFCCGLARSRMALIIGALVASVIQALLVLAVATTPIDPMFAIITPLAALLAGGIGWGAARLFFGPKQVITGETDGYMEFVDLARPEVEVPRPAMQREHQLG